MKTQKQFEESLCEIWCGTEGAASEADYREDLRQMHREMGVGGRPRFMARTWFYGAAAAAVLLLAMAGEYLFLNKRTRSVERMSYVTSSAKGEFNLPDGSHVWLNSGSSLSFDQANPRDVTLQGEGFFDVSKKDGQQFVVHTGTLDVKVLGTRFNVRSSSHFDREEVSLVSGKVEITAGDHSLMLAPGERASIAEGAIEKTSADVTADASWTGQELVFDNVALADIINSLEHWYNVNFQVSDRVPTRARLSFKVRKESLEETEHVIGRITGCRFKALDEKNILITR